MSSENTTRRVAVITGASSGIGEATARALAGDGHRVALLARRLDRIRALAEEIGDGAVAIEADVTDRDGMRAAAQRVQDELGGADILVNNAGAFPQKAWLDSDAAEWNELYNQNVGSMVRLITRLVPGMKQRGWGRVIAIASGSATMPSVRSPSYAATKAANINLAVSLAKDLAGTGVTSNAVSPGMILTPGAEDLLRKLAAEAGVPADDLEAVKAFAVKNVAPNPSGRIGQPEDIAAAVAFIASPLAGYINGANLRVDGGVVPTVN
jgi:3-oxoacyl-[acyl-carrier protein] reductase